MSHCPLLPVRAVFSYLPDCGMVPAFGIFKVPTAVDAHGDRTQHRKENLHSKLAPGEIYSLQIHREIEPATVLRFFFFFLAFFFFFFA